MNFIKKIRERRREREELNSFRKNLKIGDKVFVNDGATAFYGQVLHVWDDRIKVMSQDMHCAAHTIRCIYPID
jgi:preprotein translocase subunit YajC